MIQISRVNVLNPLIMLIYLDEYELSGPVFKKLD